MKIRRTDLAWYLLLAAMFSVGGAEAQDERAYAKEDVALSHTLEAKTPAEAWNEIEKAASHFQFSHSETSGSLVPGDPRTKYIESWLVATADKAQEFYTKFPKDTNAAAAKRKELEMLFAAQEETYATNQFPRVFDRATKFVKDANIDKAKRFEICQFVFFTGLSRRTLLPPSINVPAELEEEARIAERDFRDLGDVRLLSLFVEDSKAEKNRPMFRELSKEIPGFPGLTTKIVMSAPIKQKEQIGKPFSLQFAAFDGQNVNTAAMKGKVLVVDFWGTSYPQCIANVVRLEKLYHKFHAKGLEAIGINVDHSPEALKKFISEHEIEWPQYWDGQEMDNKMVLASLVTRAGTILLIDKKGLVRDINGDENLERKIQGLLNE